MISWLTKSMLYILRLVTKAHYDFDKQGLETEGVDITIPNTSGCIRGSIIR